MRHLLPLLWLLCPACSNATSDSGGAGASDADGSGGADSGGDAGGDGGSDGGDGTGPGRLVFNELVASPSETDDWFELYNGTVYSIDLGGLGVADEPDEAGAPWRFAAGTVLGPGGHLLVWANDGDDSEDLETDFRLSGSEGETLRLLADDDTILDEVTFPALAEDEAWARSPDGTGDWQRSETPTPGARNE